MMSSLLWPGSIGRPFQEDWQRCRGSRAVCFWRNTVRAACTKTMKSGWRGLRLTHRPASANTTAPVRPVRRGMRGQCRRPPEAAPAPTAVLWLMPEHVHWEFLPPSDRTTWGRQTWRARVQRPPLTLALTHPVLDFSTVNPTDHTFG